MVDALTDSHWSTDKFELIVVAASAGGVQALSTLVSGLPRDFALPIVVVQHVDPEHRSLLVDILSRRSLLPVETASDGLTLCPGKIYVAPPGFHLLVNPDRTMSLSESELVHFVRPSADPLFESAAASFGDRVIAVVLTGSGRDGADGVRAIKDAGGTVLAQDEETSEVFAMPKAAIATGAVDMVSPIGEIADSIVMLAQRGVTR